MEKQTPTLDKRQAVAKESQAIGRFLDWLSDEKGYTLCVYDPEIRDRFEYPPHPGRAELREQSAYFVRPYLEWFEPDLLPDPLYDYWAFIHGSTERFSESPPRRWYRDILEERYQPAMTSFNRLLHEYFEIDEQDEENELRALLEDLQQSGMGVR